MNFRYENKEKKFARTYRCSVRLFSTFFSSNFLENNLIFTVIIISAKLFYTSNSFVTRGKILIRFVNEKLYLSRPCANDRSQRIPRTRTLLESVTTHPVMKRGRAARGDETWLPIIFVSALSRIGTCDEISVPSGSES